MSNVSGNRKFKKIFSSFENIVQWKRNKKKFQNEESNTYINNGNGKMWKKEEEIKCWVSI